DYYCYSGDDNNLGFF
nr:immunoglobulin light chain junction region [Macaca mulatta]MOY06900.1 immunoglobulin light chain junction region [Macaca mulatta]MOY07966.1 immunoglobulin light chain junction region [Macaca mulatta]MOY08580.1 immunoglobulin light chain junction region [Macaca mulatta]MOY09316.1 immunoglobulin light chain junction region [Macaca mulatta]